MVEHVACSVGYVANIEALAEDHRYGDVPLYPGEGDAALAAGDELDSSPVNDAVVLAQAWFWLCLVRSPLPHVTFAQVNVIVEGGTTAPGVVALTVCRVRVNT